MYSFSRWVITLGARVCALREIVPTGKDSQQLRKEALICEAELQQLYAYAEVHHINLIDYYHPFVEIERALALIDLHLRQCLERVME